MIRKMIISKLNNLIDHRIKLFLDNNYDIYYQLNKQKHDFENATDDYLSSKVESKTIIDDLVKRFEKNGIQIERHKIDIAKFETWMHKFPEIVDQYKYMDEVKIEKILEHYLTYKFLRIDKSETYVDIACDTSSFADVIKKHFGNTCYKQDLKFKYGIHNNKIGSNAAELPTDNIFFDAMSLHCAFECFQGDSDIGFIKEAQRVLSNRGRLAIVPLYIDDVYFVKTGPKCDRRNVDIEPEARWIWRDDQYQNEPFSRHYSPEIFKQRILDKISNLHYKIVYFTNIEELEKYYPKQRIYCNFLFYAERVS